MELLPVLLIIVVLAIILKKMMKKDKEYFGSMMQLTAKGPQDLHLTVNNEKYLYPYQYTNWVWNNPTRLRRPLYFYYDYDNYYLWPYFYY